MLSGRQKSIVWKFKEPKMLVMAQSASNAQERLLMRLELWGRHRGHIFIKIIIVRLMVK